MPVIELKPEDIVVVPLSRANKWCALPYHNHPRGCPNFDKCKEHLRKRVRADDIYNFFMPMYLVYVEFDLKKHAIKMKKNHPDWSKRQCRNLLYWQRGVDRRLSKEIGRVFKKKDLYKKGYLATAEGYGINTYATARNAGLKLERIRDNIKTVRKLALLLKPNKGGVRRNVKPSSSDIEMARYFKKTKDKYNRKWMLFIQSQNGGVL